MKSGTGDGTQNRRSGKIYFYCSSSSKEAICCSGLTVITWLRLSWGGIGRHWFILKGSKAKSVQNNWLKKQSPCQKQFPVCTYMGPVFASCPREHKYKCVQSFFRFSSWTLSDTGAQIKTVQGGPVEREPSQQCVWQRTDSASDLDWLFRNTCVQRGTHIKLKQCNLLYLPSKRQEED